LVISLAAILLSLHCSIVSDRYTKSLKSWSMECVDEANRTLQRNARIIERELLEKLAPTNEEIEFVRNFDANSLNIKENGEENVCLTESERTLRESVDD